jgi:hypothetical protein
MLQDIVENERNAHKLGSLPLPSICCYDAKLVLEDAPETLFMELLRVHNHLFLSGNRDANK